MAALAEKDEEVTQGVASLSTKDEEEEEEEVTIAVGGKRVFLGTQLTAAAFNAANSTAALRSSADALDCTGFRLWTDCTTRAIKFVEGCCEVSGRRVLELGCSAARGSRRRVAGSAPRRRRRTARTRPSRARRNFALRRARDPKCKNVAFETLRWGGARRRYDLVAGSELMYFSTPIDDLVATIAARLKPKTTTTDSRPPFALLCHIYRAALPSGSRRPRRRGPRALRASAALGPALVRARPGADAAAERTRADAVARAQRRAPGAGSVIEDPARAPARDALRAHDALWLRYNEVPAATRTSLYGALEGANVAIVADADDPAALDPTREIVLDAVGDELMAAFAAMFPAAGPTPRPRRALVNVSSRAFASELGAEGYRLRGATIEAATASGAFYGAFALLGLIQRREPLPAVRTSVPRTRLRHWDLWDELDGSVTRGYAGRSLFWPMALFEGRAAAHGPGLPGPVRRVGSAAALVRRDARGRRVNTVARRERGDGRLPDDGLVRAARAGLRRNAADVVLQCDERDARRRGGRREPDMRNARRRRQLPRHQRRVGPRYRHVRCHSTDEGDYTHQQFVVDGATIRSARDRTACLGVSRPNPPWEGAADPWVPAGAWKSVSDALCALKSAGLNGVVLLDVNACGPTQTESLRPGPMHRIAANLRPLFERYAMAPLLSSVLRGADGARRRLRGPAAPAARVVDGQGRGAARRLGPGWRPPRQGRLGATSARRGRSQAAART
ncbi:alpha-glucuronidase [Aureococcus anophagefferens]|nr:alpha-glucuronidase [Aureococcus anophagefferens]